MTDYILYEDMYFIVNISFVYLGLGECFQTRPRSKLFCKFQSVLFVYMTVISGYGAVSGVYMFFAVVSSSDNEMYSIEDAAQILPSCLLDAFMILIDVIIFSKKELNKEIIRDISAIYPKDDEIDEDTRAILMKKMKPVKLVIQFYSGLTNLQPFGFCLIPVYMTLVMKKGFKLPFMMWYPYDFTASSSNYLLTVYTQFIAAGYTAFSLAAVDCAIVIIMVNISMHLELLAHRLRAISPQKETLDDHDLKTANNQLDEIVKDHVHIINLLNKFQGMYSSILLIKYVMTAGLICLCLFSIMISSHSRKVNFVMFLSSMLIQMFIICWYGHEIVEKSEELCQAAYESSWPDLDQRFKKNMLILQMRTQKPLELNAMGFARVSLSAFTAIVKAGWSFFSITRQVFEGSPTNA